MRTPTSSASRRRMRRRRFSGAFVVNGSPTQTAMAEPPARAASSRSSLRRGRAGRAAVPDRPAAVPAALRARRARVHHRRRAWSTCAACATSTAKAPASTGWRSHRPGRGRSSASNRASCWRSLVAAAPCPPQLPAAHRRAGARAQGEWQSAPCSPGRHRARTARVPFRRRSVLRERAAFVDEVRRLVDGAPPPLRSWWSMRRRLRTWTIRRRSRCGR